MQLSQLEKAVFTSLIWSPRFLRCTTGRILLVSKSKKPALKLLRMATSTGAILVENGRLPIAQDQEMGSQHASNRQMSKSGQVSDCYKGSIARGRNLSIVIVWMQVWMPSEPLPSLLCPQDRPGRNLQSQDARKSLLGETA